MDKIRLNNIFTYYKSQNNPLEQSKNRIYFVILIFCGTMRLPITFILRKHDEKT